MSDQLYTRIARLASRYGIDPRVLARRGMGDINTVAQTIQQVEGYFPGSLAYTNNNPGNLKAVGQPSCTPTSGGFCSFPDYATGFQALLNQISLDASRGLTIAQFTNKYAPASDSNDPASYAATIANASGLSVNDPLSAALSGGSSGSSAGSAIDLGGSDASGSPDNSLLWIAVALFGVAIAWEAFV